MHDRAESAQQATVTDEVIEYEDFAKIDLRIGQIVTAAVNPKARRPAYVLTIDLGELGTKTSSAQITDHYSAEQLVGQQVVCVTNFAPKRIAGVKSEVLVLGAVERDGAVVLLTPTQQVTAGLPIA